MSRRWFWLLCVLLVLPLGLQAQVMPAPTPGTSVTFPPTDCTPQVAVGVTAQGILVCAPVTIAQTTGLVPSGVDVTATGQVLATHLAVPLPPPQGGTGLASGTSGGILYYSGVTTLTSTGLLPQNAPMVGGGVGQPPTTGTRSGTTLEFATVLGPKVLGKQVVFDANGNLIASTADIGGSAVISVFTRTGAISSQAGDYTAAQVTNAADVTAANIFTHASGQTMPRLVLQGTTSGTLTLRGPAIAGASMLTFPAGTTDFSATGGASQVVRQASPGAALTVSQLGFADLTGAATAAQLPSLATLGAADLSAANVFPHPSGQTMARVLLQGSTSGTVSLRAPAIAGTSIVTFPAGTTDFSATGGPSQVVRQSSSGAALTVNQLGFADLTGAATAAQVPSLPNLTGVLPTIKGGTSFTDTSYSGTTHVLATVQGPLVPGQGVTIDAQGNVITTGSPAGSGTGVSSVFNRTGAVTAAAGDYTAAQVTGAADLSAANVFAHASGQSVRQLLLPGSTSGTVTLKAAAIAGTSTLTLPGGTTDFSQTGGLAQVVRQSSPGAALTVSQLGFGDLLGVATVAQLPSLATLGAADLSAANVFAHASGQSMRQLLLPGSTSGTLTVKAAASAGASTLTLPGGTTDFSSTGGTSFVVRQSTPGGALSVSQLGFADVSGTATATQVPPLPTLLGTLPTAKGGTGFIDTTYSGSTHVLATVQGTLTTGNCLTADASGSITTTGSPCGTGGGGSVTSVFSRTGVVTAQTGDYTAAQVTNAADLTIANVFTHATGQSMKQLLLPGSTSGLLTVKAAAIAATSTLILPGGSTDFSTTGGVNQVVRQSSVGGALTVSQLSASNLSNGVTGSGALVLQTNPTIPALANLTQNGFVKTSGGTGTLGIDTATYLTGNQTITLSGDATGVGTTAITVAVQKLNGGAFTGQAGNLVAFGANNTPVDSTLPGGQVVTASSVFSTGHVLQSAGTLRTVSDSGVLTSTLELNTNKATSVFLGTSDTLYPTQNAVKAYVDGQISTIQSIGTLGALQASDGAGSFAAYAGSDCSDPLQPIMRGVSATGQALCRDAPSGVSAAHVLTDRPEALIPNAVNLGARPSGVVVTQVTTGVAAISTLPAPAGQLAGTLGPQTLHNTAIPPRSCPLANTTTSVAPLLDDCDGLIIANLTQGLTIQNPQGSATALQWLRMQVCSATPQPLTWGTQWSGEAGFPLPTTTRGGGQCDFLLFQYIATTSHMTLLFNTGLVAAACVGLATPGTYPNATVTIDSRGCLAIVSPGTGGGGGSAPAGLLGDVQLRDGAGAAADSGVLTHDVLTHWTRLQQALVGSGVGAIALIDPRQFRHTMQTSPLTQDRWETKPDTSGMTMLAQGGVPGIPRGSANTGFVTAELSGDCATAGSNVITCGSAIARLGAPNPQTTNYQVTPTDFDQQKTIPVANGSPTFTLVASGQQPTAGKYIRIVNYGSGVVTIARSGQNLNGQTTSPTLAAGSALAPTSAFVQSDGTDYLVFLAGAGGSATFSALTGSTNTTAAMVVGTGASLGVSGTGAITATALAANPANCAVAGTFPNGVDAAGVAENCVTLSAVNPQTATYQVLAADFDSYKTIPVASGTFTITLVASGGTQPTAGKYIRIINYGSGVVTIARSGQNINGQTTSLTLPAGTALAPKSAFIVSDGTNYFAFPTGGTGGTGYIQLPMSGAKLPATNPGVIDNSENNTRILFDAATQECVLWQFRMNPDYASTPVLKFQYSMTSATTGGIAIEVSLMVTAPGASADVNTDSYDTVNICTDATVPATAGFMKELSCALTNNDTLGGGGLTKLKLCRAPANATDTATGDLEALAAQLEYTKN